MPTISAIHGVSHDGTTCHRSTPAQNAAAAPGSAQAFTRYTVTKGRICSSVAGPMPLTSTRSSTVENGPFCVR